MRIGIVLLCMCFCAYAHAEQKYVFGPYEVHYIVVPTTFLNEKIVGTTI